MAGVVSEAPPVPALTADLWCLIHSKCDFEVIANSMLMCKMFREQLPKLVKSISTEVPITQATLDYISRTFPALEELDLRPEYDDRPPRLDFSRLTFPALTRLSVSCSPLATCRFTTQNTPKLQALNLEQQTNPLYAFELELPELESVSFDFVTADDCSRLGASLSACPKLRSFSSYKFWGPDDVYELRLPRCERLCLRRSDSLEGLRIWAPRLTSLDLQGCFALTSLHLLDDPPQPQQPPGVGQQQEEPADNAPAGPAAAAELPPPPPSAAAAGPGGGGGDGGEGGGSELAKLTVNLVNTNATRQTLQHLRGHPRVGRRRVFAPNDDPERAWEAVAFGGMGGGGGDDGEGDDDGDDDEEDEDGEMNFDGQMGPDLAQFLQAMAAGGGGGPGGFGPFGGMGGFGGVPLGAFGGFPGFGGMHGGGGDSDDDDEDEDEDESEGDGEGDEEEEEGEDYGGVGVDVGPDMGPDDPDEDLEDVMRRRGLGGPEMLMMLLMQQLQGAGGGFPMGAGMGGGMGGIRMPMGMDIGGMMGMGMGMGGGMAGVRMGGGGGGGGAGMGGGVMGRGVPHGVVIEEEASDEEGGGEEGAPDEGR